MTAMHYAAGKNDVVLVGLLAQRDPRAAGRKDFR